MTKSISWFVSSLIISSIWTLIASFYVLMWLALYPLDLLLRTWIWSHSSNRDLKSPNDVSGIIDLDPIKTVYLAIWDRSRFG